MESSVTVNDSIRAVRHRGYPLGGAGPREVAAVP